MNSHGIGFMLCNCGFFYLTLPAPNEKATLSPVPLVTTTINTAFTQQVTGSKQIENHFHMSSECMG